MQVTTSPTLNWRIFPSPESQRFAAPHFVRYCRSVGSFKFARSRSGAALTPYLGVAKSTVQELESHLPAGLEPMLIWDSRASSSRRAVGSELYCGLLDMWGRQRRRVR